MKTLLAFVVALLIWLIPATATACSCCGQDGHGHAKAAAAAASPAATAQLGFKAGTPVQN